MYVYVVDARTAWTCCLCVALERAQSVALHSGAATSVHRCSKMLVSRRRLISGKKFYESKGWIESMDLLPSYWVFPLLKCNYISSLQNIWNLTIILFALWNNYCYFSNTITSDLFYKEYIQRSNQTFSLHEMIGVPQLSVSADHSEW